MLGAPGARSTARRQGVATSLPPSAAMPTARLDAWRGNFAHALNAVRSAVICGGGGTGDPGGRRKAPSSRRRRCSPALLRRAPLTIGKSDQARRRQGDVCAGSTVDDLRASRSVSPGRKRRRARYQPGSAPRQETGDPSRAGPQRPAVDGVADQPEHRRPEAHEQRPSLSVPAFVLAHRLCADPQDDAQGDRTQRHRVEGPAARFDLPQRLTEHIGSLTDPDQRRI